jgi:hypothetical protein
MRLSGHDSRTWGKVALLRPTRFKVSLTICRLEITNNMPSRSRLSQGILARGCRNSSSGYICMYGRHMYYGTDLPDNTDGL